MIKYTVCNHCYVILMPPVTVTLSTEQKDILTRSLSY